MGNLVPKSSLKNGTKSFEGSCFPAQFIAEGLDQTRGWFYSLIVLGVALFGKSPYEHVIVNGLVLAEDGKKMSKKLRNYPDPMELADRVGVDAMRYYLLSSPVVRGEDLNFSEKEVLELQRKNIGRLHNVLAMYELYADGTAASATSTHVLDRWIIARLNQLIADSEAGYKAYELDRATRPLADFIDDLSVWYLRRSRERLKSDDVTDKQFALRTLRHVLQNLALVMAPAMPFYAEYLWQAVKGDGDVMSVHLGVWPKGGEVDPVVIGEMSIVREFVTLALEARTKSGIKVRQPLALLSTSIELTAEYAEIVADEVNVKKVMYASAQTERVVLDITLTPELIAEGQVRELIRAIQEQRKTEGLAPQDRIILTLATTATGQALVEQFQDTIMKTVGATAITYGETSGNSVTAGEHLFTLAVTKVS
jgi:isoleucyl-tRNA synthetase